MLSQTDALLYSAAKTELLEVRQQEEDTLDLYEVYRAALNSVSPRVAATGMKDITNRLFELSKRYKKLSTRAHQLLYVMDHIVNGEGDRVARHNIRVAWNPDHTAFDAYPPVFHNLETVPYEWAYSQLLFNKDEKMVAERQHILRLTGRPWQQSEVLYRSVRVPDDHIHEYRLVVNGLYERDGIYWKYK